MRVWIAPSRYAPHLGGIETVTRHLAQALTRAGDEVTVITHRHPSHLPALEMIDDVVVRRLRFESPSMHWQAATRFARSCASVRAELQQLMIPDVIHVHGGSSQMFHLTRYADARNIPLILTTHGEISMDAHHVYQRSAFLRASFRYGVRSAKFVTAPSRYTLEEAATLAPRVLSIGQVVPNGIVAASWAISGEVPRSGRVFAWGRLEPQKGFDRLVEVWPRVRLKFPGAELRVAGEGEQLSKLESNMSPGVILVGRLDQPGLMKELSTTQFAAVPSRLEAFGMSALEALAAGRRVLHSGLPALSDLVGQHGWVANHEDPDALADGIVAALRAAPGAVPHDWVDRFEWGGVVEKYRTLYKSRPTGVGAR